MSAPLLKRWTAGEVPMPDSTVVQIWGASRDHHSYIVSFDPRWPENGYSASYKDLTDSPSTTRFLAGDEDGFPDLDAARAACEADLQRLRGRLQ